MSSQKSMPVTVPANQANFTDLIHRATSGKEHFIVEEEGKPVVAIISKQEYDDLMQDHEAYEQDKQVRLKKFREAARSIGKAIEESGMTEEQLMEELEKDKEAVYQKYYGNPAKQ